MAVSLRLTVKRCFLCGGYAAGGEASKSTWKPAGEPQAHRHVLRRRRIYR